MSQVHSIFIFTQDGKKNKTEIHILIYEKIGCVLLNEEENQEINRSESDLPGTWARCQCC